MRSELQQEVQEDLAIYIKRGGEFIDPVFLKGLSLTQHASDLLQQCVKRETDIPAKYIGIHARNTNNSIKNDWKSYISHVHKKT